MIACFTTFAGESGSRAWSESTVEGVVYARQSHMRKVKGHREIVGTDIYYQSMLIFAYNPLIYREKKVVGECRPNVKNLHPKKVGPHHLGAVSQQYLPLPIAEVVFTSPCPKNIKAEIQPSYLSKQLDPTI
jgi:hypothetical protein